MSPSLPYAFMNFGNALSNANRFDESLKVLGAAMDILHADSNADPEAVEHVKDNLRRSMYGRASMRRDMAYQEGQGNITEAREFALQQLPLSPYPPRILHDIATMELMLCDAAPHMCDSARNRLQQAQQSSVVQYMTLRAKNMRTEAQESCPASAAVLSGDDWLQCPDVSSYDQSLPAGLVALRAAPPLLLLGSQGVLLFDDLNNECACKMLSPASDPLFDVFNNMASAEDPLERLSAVGKPFISACCSPALTRAVCSHFGSTTGCVGVAAVGGGAVCVGDALVQHLQRARAQCADRIHDAKSASTRRHVPHQLPT